MAFLLTFSGGASATYKDAVRVARDTQLALTGSHPIAGGIDGVTTLADKDRVLLRGQTDQSENGIYVYNVAGGNYTLTRSLDANNSNEVLPNMLVPVSEGTANADKIFQLVSPNVAPITLDTDNLVFTDVLIGLANKADRDLANLLPTSINQSLLFGDDTSYNIGAAAASRPQTLYVKSAINLASLTASEILASDASKNVVSLSTATYPSLTELARVKGVTSGIQEQLDLKVDSVSGTAPIASSGGVTPTISISQSGAAQDGYLSSTDWNTFNNKQNALSFGNLTEATSSVLTISGGTGAVIGSGSSIQVKQSGAAQDGYLSSTDWNTFNNKQAALSFGDLTSSDITVTGGVGAVIGSGTSLSLTKGNLSETTSSVLTISGGTSAVLGSGVTIEVAQSGSAQSGYLSSADWSTFNAKQDALPSQSGNEDKVLVSDGSALSWQYAGLGSGNFGNNNVILGRDKPASITTATESVIIGKTAGNAVTTGGSIVAVGHNALKSAQATGISVAIGTNAAENYNAAQFSGIVAIGSSALRNATTGAGNTAVGQSALEQVTSGGQNTALGWLAGRYVTSSNNTFVGRAAGTGVSGQTTGSSNTAVGQVALTALTTGGANVAIGARAADALTTSSNNIAIGTDSLTTLTNGGSNVVVGTRAAEALTTGSLNILLGHTAGDAITTGSNNVIIGDIAGSAALADTIIVAAGNAERFRVDSAGNMGIGTSTPAEKLEVDGNVKANSAILNGATSGNITLSAADTTTPYSVKLPAAQGAANAFLENDGSGNLSWTLIPDPLPAYSDDKVLYSTASAAEWRTVGTGSTSAAYPANTVILGRSKPASLTGTANTIIGDGAANAITTSTNNVLIGTNAANTLGSQGSNLVVIGSGALNRGSSSVTIGHNAGVSGDAHNVVWIGANTGNIGAAVNCIAIGREAKAGSNEFAIGSSTAQINLMLLGRGGQSQTAANAVKIMTMRSSGTNTDMSVGTLTIAGAQGTGTGAGGDVIIATAPPAVSSGSSLNAHVERMRVTDDGDVGIGTATPSAKLDVRGSAVFNEDGADVDFRVEGDTDANLINVDAGNDAVGIGVAGAVEKLEVGGNLLVANHAVITQTLRPRDGVGSAQHDLLVRGGDGVSGNHDGGDVTIQGGLKNGTGADGELIFKVAGAEAAKISNSNNLDLSCGLIVNSAHAQAGTANVITVANDDFYVGVDCSGAAKTVNLPTAVVGKKLVIKDESGDAGTNNITVSGTIDGAANYVMAVDYEALTLVSDGTNWFII